MNLNLDGSLTVIGADPTGQTDSTAIIQAHVDYLYSTFSGGTLWLPPGNYLCRGLVIKGAVTLRGHGRGCTMIQCQKDDQNTVLLDSTVDYGGLRDLFICGYTDPKAKHSNAVSVASNVPAVIQNCSIWGGASALFTQGADGSYEDLYLCGWSYACIVSNGANWFRRVKADVAGGTAAPQWGFSQGTPFMPNTPIENHFHQCDFSGDYGGGSVQVDDNGAHQSISIFEGCVTSGAIHIDSARHTSFASHEFGSAMLHVGAGSLSVVGSIAYTPLRLPGTAAKAANVGIN